MGIMYGRAVVGMREDTMQMLKHYKIKTFGMKKNIEAVEHLIENGEELKFISFANFSYANPEFPSRPTPGAGAIAITDKTLYIHDMMKQPNDSKLSMDNLNIVSCKATGLSGASFRFVFPDIALVAMVGFYQKALAEELFKAILGVNTGLVVNQLADVEADAAASTINAESVSQDSTKAGDATEALRKYKSLLDDGVITQAEFDAKKRQLLGL